MAMRGIKRAFFRAPIWVYRAHCGWLFGHRLLYLETLGRKSGQLRRTVLEVVKRDRETGSYYVVAGFGAKSDWFQNAIAHPPVTVIVSRTRFTPQCHVLTENERFDLLSDYQREHPKVAAALGARVLGSDFTDDPAALRRLAVALPALRLSPAQH
jgi:deazaflavin-dependent oxidoreductase (nitroreductase family)